MSIKPKNIYSVREIFSASRIEGEHCNNDARICLNDTLKDLKEKYGNDFIGREIYRLQSEYFGKNESEQDLDTYESFKSVFPELIKKYGEELPEIHRRINRQAAKRHQADWGITDVGLKALMNNAGEIYSGDIKITVDLKKLDKASKDDSSWVKRYSLNIAELPIGITGR